MDTVKRLLKITGTALIILFTFLAVFILLSVMWAKLNGGQPRLLGYSFHIVLTDSMTPDINPGDFVLGKTADKKDIKEGDYIIFVSPDPALKGITIIHKVLSVNNESGIISFTTTGIKEGANPDEYPVYEIEGRYVLKSAFLGKVFKFLSDIEDLLFGGVIISLIIIIIRQVKNIFSLKKSK
jgi:signal peptidase I